MESNRKIFQIGFNKCGTNSINNLFNQYCEKKIPSIHWANGYLANTIYNNIYSGSRFPLDGFDKYSVFTDMECFVQQDDETIKYIAIYKDFFDLLDINYPDSIFIYNTRNLDRWITSRLNHVMTYSCMQNNLTKQLPPDQYYMYIDLFKKIYNTDNEKDITDIWQTEWWLHRYAVKEYFQYRPNDVLFYDIEKDNFDKFINFFKNHDISFTTQSLPMSNNTVNNYIIYKHFSKPHK